MSSTGCTCSSELLSNLDALPGFLTGRPFQIKESDVSEREIRRRGRSEASNQAQLPVRHFDSASATRPGPESNRDVIYSPKSHYRIVFKELCKPLLQEKSLCNIVLALYDTTSILQHLHRLNWVHRDISAGNILLFYSKEGDEFVTKLSDLEYAKKTGSPSGQSHDVRTVTDEFMPVEVWVAAYLFIPRGPAPADITSDLPDLDHASLLSASAEASPSLTLPSRVKLSPWFYNPLHDLESIWWLMAYFLFTKDFKFTPNDNSEPIQERCSRISRQEAYAASLFAYRDFSIRHPTVLTSGYFRRRLELLPPGLEEAGRWLDRALEYLVKVYIEAEKHVSLIDHKVAEPSLYNNMRTCLGHIARAVNTHGRHTVTVSKSVFEALREITDATAQKACGSTSSVKRGLDSGDEASGGSKEGTHTLPSTSAKRRTARQDQ